MFGCNDKLNLVINNATNWEGNVIPLNIILPIQDESEIDLKEDLASLRLFEYVEGPYIGGQEIYNIYLGYKASFRELISLMQRVNEKIDFARVKGINNFDDLVWYTKKEDGTIVPMQKIQGQDVVFESLEELKEFILNLSLAFKDIRENTQRIRTHNFNK